jgi:hypothetical protein
LSLFRWKPQLLSKLVGSIRQTVVLLSLPDDFTPAFVFSH